MKKTSLIISLIGIALLLALLMVPPASVEKYSDISEMKLNKKVSLTGEVTDERDFDGFRIITLNEIEIVCDCNNGIIYAGKSIEVIGVISEYEKKKQIKALKINILD